MTEKLRTAVIYFEDRFRRECRLQIGKIECAKIVLEIEVGEEGIQSISLEELANADPHVMILELSKDREQSISLLKELHHQFSNLPFLAAGESFDSAFLIEALRLGVREILARPLSHEKLYDTYQRLHKLTYEKRNGRNLASIFSFFSCKGGSGSTTIVTNFAVSLSKISKKRILVLDLDLELGDVADYFGIRSKKFLLQVCGSKGILDPTLISRTIVTHPKTGIDILSLSDGFSRNARSMAEEIKHLLFLLQKDYDYIIVDTSSAINDNIVSVLDSSHLIFLISKCSLPALRNAQRVLHGFERLGYSQNQIRILLNRYLRGEDVSIREVERVLNFKVFWSIPNDYKSSIRSLQSGEPLTLHNGSHPLSKSFYEMSAQVLGIQLEDRPKPPTGGLLIGARDGSAKSLHLTTLNLLKS